jgi:nucleoside-diphosphate-sugar epimerase
MMFLLGAGYSARALARMAIDAGWQVAGTTRSPDKLGALEKAGIAPLLFDGSRVDAPMAAALEDTTHLVVSVGPSAEGGSDTLFGLMAEQVRSAMPALAWVGYFSTVGVYGDRDGGWVDENSECRPRPGRSEARLAAEHDWADLASERGVPIALLRLSGIYGPKRNALVNLAEGTARRLVKPGQVFNRVHVDDIAGATLMLAAARTAGVFNVTDDEPAPPQDVVAFAAALMGVEPPPETAFEEAELSPMARSFYGENKRVSNAKLKQAGYQFRHPDYRAALRAMWQSGNWS